MAEANPRDRDRASRRRMQGYRESGPPERGFHVEPFRRTDNRSTTRRAMITIGPPDTDRLSQYDAQLVPADGLTPLYQPGQMRANRCSNAITDALPAEVRGHHRGARRT
jgi:hypothetical protein